MERAGSCLSATTNRAPHLDARYLRPVTARGIIAAVKRIRWLLLAVLLALSAASAYGAPQPAPGAPVLINPGFECEADYHPQPGIVGLIPNGWTAQLLQGNPSLNSARMYFTQECTRDGFVERLEGYDSFVYAAEDLETPPLPGKPFDALIYQQTAVTPGVAYSLSGWMVSLCGGSFSNPNDCPPDYYMAKMVGLDPSGGTGPLAASVVWVEDRRNFTESRWANLRLAVRAEAPMLTVFARVNSPFRWHGNHAFADAFSLLRAPTAEIVGLPAVQPGREVEVRWQGDLGPDIPAIPGGNYALLFDLQYRVEPGGAWVDWLSGESEGSAVFRAPYCSIYSYAFRVRPRAEQPDGVGARPNHRYPGVWSDPVAVTFDPGVPCVPRAYLPAVLR